MDFLAARKNAHTSQCLASFVFPLETVFASIFHFVVFWDDPKMRLSLPGPVLFHMLLASSWLYVFRARKHIHAHRAKKSSRVFMFGFVFVFFDENTLAGINMWKNMPSGQPPSELTPEKNKLKISRLRSDSPPLPPRTMLCSPQGPIWEEAKTARTTTATLHTRQYLFI